MKQILQNLADGGTQLTDVPCPQNKPGNILIRTRTTLVSAGTERMLVAFGKANYLEKARQQPEKVRMVLDKVKTDGLLPTVDAVRSKLDQPLPLGYCNAGTVLQAGDGVDGFSPGERVVSNGNHAQIVCAPQNLCAKIPDGVSDEAAAFTVLGAIALQGIRLANPTLGEAVVVTGLGLVGLLTVQLLRAHGCRVLGLDYDAEKLRLARRFGAATVDLANGEDPLAAARAFSRGRGVDAVIITASTQSNEPVHQAAVMCRKRGRIVLVGVTGLELSRADFYEKELSFQVSCSYGPGRYDQAYEENGMDYPVGFVRWTEQRNFEAVLDIMAGGGLDHEPLVSHRFALQQAPQAYELLAGDQPSLGIVLEYPRPDIQPDAELLRREVCFDALPAGQPSGTPSALERSAAVSFIGAGNYAGRVLIPAFKRASAVLHSVATSGGVNGVHFGRKYGFRTTTTDAGGLLADEQCNAVVIATPHDSHARLVLQAAQAGKHVFVEKPLCLTLDELAEIKAAYRGAHDARPAPMLMVGFNRRFAPQVQKMKSLLGTIPGPKSFIMTVNAGEIPPDHWTQDRHVGGGRIVGEGCHFIDLLRFLAGAPVTAQQASYIGQEAGVADCGDIASFTLQFADGSFGTLHYLANGHKAFPKERLEVFCVGRVLQLDNFRKLKGYGWPGFKQMNLLRQDKGQSACARAFVDAVRSGGRSPIPLDEIIEVSRVSIELATAQHDQR